MPPPNRRAAKCCASCAHFEPNYDFSTCKAHEDDDGVAVLVFGEELCDDHEEKTDGV